MIFKPHKSHSCIARLVFVTLYSVFGIVGFIDSAQSVEVRGSYAIEVYLNNGVTNRADREFSVNLGDQRWEITTKSANPTNNVRYYQTTFDGTNIFSFTAFNTNYYNGTTNKPKNDSLGIVHTEHYPPYDNSLVQPIWMAFCSGSYFKGMSNSSIPSFFAIGSPNSPLRFCKVHIEMFDQTSQLPSSIQIFNEGKVIQDLVSPPKPGGSMSKVTGHVLTNAPAPYNQGYLNAEYKVIDRTNFNGAVLPLRFEINIFGMKANGESPSDLAVDTRIVGVIKTVEASEPPRLQPELGSRSLIYDNRIVANSRTGAAYWPSNRWLPVGDVQQSLTNDKYAKEEPKRRSYLLVFAILSITGLLAIFVLSTKKK